MGTADFDTSPERMIPLEQYMEQHYPFTLPPLPYGYDALAPELIVVAAYGKLLPKAVAMVCSGEIE